MTIRSLVRSSLAVFIALTLTQPAQAEPVEVTIDAGQPSAPVSPYLYGMFIEPIGNLVGRTLWAEMLDDRKFQADVLPASVDPDPPPRPHAPPGIGYRKWRPQGDAGAVAMDRTSSIGGEQSVRVAVGTEARGIVQGGIAIARGRRYVGSVWINGDGGAKVQVELAWGDRPCL